MRKFLTTIASAVEEENVLHNQPLVLAGVAYVTAMFAELVGNKLIILGCVDGNMDDQSTSPLHAAAWPVVDRHLQQNRGDALDQLHAADPVRVANSGETVANAALQGRIERMLYVPRVDITGTLNEQDLKVPKANNSAAEHGYVAIDLVDLALRHTTLSGGVA